MKARKKRASSNECDYSSLLSFTKFYENKGGAKANIVYYLLSSFGKFRILSQKGLDLHKSLLFK